MYIINNLKLVASLTRFFFFLKKHTEDSTGYTEQYSENTDLGSHKNKIQAKEAQAAETKQPPKEPEAAQDPHDPIALAAEQEEIRGGPSLGRT